MTSLILASSSPRRKELLENICVSFRVVNSDADESYSSDWKPDQIVMELASRKASTIAEQFPQAYVIGADTVVALHDKILGKPKNSDEAYVMLKQLSGSIHSVYTGVSIASPHSSITFYEKTDVLFWELTDEEILQYIRTNEPFDKAGAYGIQGFGGMFVKEINGDYFTVVGLPISRTVRELKKLGYKAPQFPFV